MPDAHDPGLAHASAPDGWSGAFAALPMEAPPADGWPRLAARLDALPRRARRRSPLLLATAASVLVAVAAGWLLVHPRASAPAVPGAVPATTVATAAADPALAQLQAESARLETLLRVARDPRVSSGTAAVLALDLEARVARIDAALAQPGLDRDRQVVLWRERVDSLRTLAGFEGNRRWLATQGQRYDAALVRID